MNRESQETKTLRPPLSRVGNAASGGSALDRSKRVLLSVVEQLINLLVSAGLSVDRLQWVAQRVGQVSPDSLWIAQFGKITRKKISESESA